MVPFVNFHHANFFFIKMQINSVTVLTWQGSVFDTLKLKIFFIVLHFCVNVTISSLYIIV